MVAHANNTQPGPRDPAVRSITEALSAPFDPREIKFKPQMVKNNRALDIAYVDVRLSEGRSYVQISLIGWPWSISSRLRPGTASRWPSSPSRSRTVAWMSVT